MYFVVANILLLISESISSSSAPTHSAIEPWQPEPWTPVVAHSRPSRLLAKPAWTGGEEMMIMTKKKMRNIKVGNRVKDLAIFVGLSYFLWVSIVLLLLLKLMFIYIHGECVD